MNTRLAEARTQLLRAHVGPAFGPHRFGAFAERFARTFGRPEFLLVQTALVAGWLAWNAAVGSPFDPYPFILLNLAFSTQAAYAAPLILLAQTRQADRDRVWSEADVQHREEVSSSTLRLLEENTRITQQVETLLKQNTQLTEQVADLARHIEVLSEAIHVRLSDGGSAPA